MHKVLKELSKDMLDPKVHKVPKGQQVLKEPLQVLKVSRSHPQQLVHKELKEHQQVM